MCATAGSWLSRFTCCVSAPSTSASRDAGDDDVARYGGKDTYRRCCSVRRQHISDGARSFNSRCRRRSEHAHMSKAIKSGDDEDVSDMKSRFPVFNSALCNDDIGSSKLMTDLEYVCCCDRCDSVMGWYLTTVSADAASEQSLHTFASSLRLQNYIVACDADRSRTAFAACRGPPDSEGTYSAGGEDMDISLISSCHIKGVDLLAGHQLKKEVEYNELIGCFRPPPNRTIGHIYLAAAATTQQEAAESCHHGHSTRCCPCATDVDDCASTTCCGVFRKTRRRRHRSAHRMSTDKYDVQHLDKR